MRKNKYVDAHCHLADQRFDVIRNDVVARANEKNIFYFMGGGVDPNDWARQLEIQKSYNYFPCFGLHPYFVAEHSEQECEQALDVLPTYLSKSIAIGEIGLDFRPHIMKNSGELQKEVFRNQLEIAEMVQQPFVLHIVRAHEEALQILDWCGIPSRGGMVHAFNGSLKKAMEFIERGLFLSIGGAICIENNLKLRQAVENIPIEFLLIESDAPDQAPPSFNGGLNEPFCVWEIAQQIAKIRHLSAEEMMDQSLLNFKRLFNNAKF